MASKNRWATRTVAVAHGGKRIRLSRIDTNPAAPSDEVILNRLVNESITWHNAVMTQTRRIEEDQALLADPYAISDRADPFIIEIDFHFLLVALVRLRRCVKRSGDRVPALASVLRDRLAHFDAHVPNLSRLRNIAEHSDEYNLGEGRDTSVEARAIQRWEVDNATDGGVIWDWLDERFDVTAAHDAATRLLRGFADDVADWRANHLSKQA